MVFRPNEGISSFAGPTKDLHDERNFHIKVTERSSDDVQKALLHYHPDHASQHGPEWFFKCEVRIEREYGCDSWGNTSLLNTHPTAVNRSECVLPLTGSVNSHGNHHRAELQTSF